VIQTEQFGPLLRAARLSRRVRQQELARAVGVTPEHLSRIERGRRPPPRSAVVERVIAALALADAEANRLRIAARIGLAHSGYSDASAVAAVHQLLRATASSLKDDQTKPTGTLPSEPLAIDLVGHLPIVVKGEAEVAQLWTSMLQAAERSTPLSEPIRLSVNPLEGPFSIGARTWPRFRNAMRAVLQHGWTIQHIWRGIGEPRAYVELLTGIMDLFGLPGRYETFHIQRADTLPEFVTDVCFVPGVGVAQVFQTAGPERFVAVVLRDQESMWALARHLDAIRRAGATPFVQALPFPATGPDRYAINLRSEAESFPVDSGPGGRFLVKEGLSFYLVPAHVWRRRANQRLASVPTPERPALAAYLDGMLGWQQRRLEAFHQHVQRWVHRDVCLRGELERFVKHGVMFQEWDNLAPPLPPLPVEDRADILIELITRLRKYPNYELAIADRFPEGVSRVYWIIKARQGVSLVVNHAAKANQPTGFTVHVTEPGVNAAFTASFEQLWDEIPAKLRERESVCRWLERQLEKLD
jgi:transcriptional regulator with XRE-family HTH domain